MISLIKNALILTVNQQNEVLKNSDIVIAGGCIQTIGDVPSDFQNLVLLIDSEDECIFDQ
jgi:hypothetical protein